MRIALGIVVGFASVGVWLFVITALFRSLLNFFADGKEWWSGPLYVALAFPLAIAGMAGVFGCGALGIWIMGVFQ